MKALRAGLDEDAVTVELEGSELRIAVITGLAKVCGDYGCGELLAIANFAGAGVDLRDAGEYGTRCEAVVNHLLIMVVKVSEDSREDDEARKEGDEETAQNAVPKVVGLCSAASGIPVFEFDWQIALSFDC